MIRGLYTATTGMVAQQIKEETISNNLANLDTPGFKREEVLTKPFPQVMLAWQANDAALNPSRQNLGNITLGTMVDQTLTVYEAGPVVETENPTDVALLGEGFLTISTAQGTRYTRNGNLGQDAQGYLVNSNGYYVMGVDGRLKVDGGAIAIDEAGHVRAGDKEVGTLAIVSFADLTKLQKTRDNLWEDVGDQPPLPAGTRVKQGSLEKANVNLVNELVNMLAVTRAYEANQKMIQAQDDILEKSVNQLGSVR